MNPHVRAPTPPPGDPRLGALMALVPALQARIWTPELRALAAGLDAGDLLPAPLAQELVRAATEDRAARSSIRARAEALRAEAGDLSGEALNARLLRHLDATVPSPVQRWLDRRALRRNLDLSALLEREAGRMETRGVRLELVALALGGLLVCPGHPDDALHPEVAAELLVRSGAARLLVAMLADEPRPATRRAAAGSLARILATHAARGAPVDADALRLLRRVIRDPADDPWVRRQALQIVGGLEEELAQSWTAELLSAQEAGDGFLVRARAVELLLERPERRLHVLALTMLEDPSEAVRATLATGLLGLARRGDPGAEQVLAPLRALLTQDPEPRVRARVAAGLGGLAQGGRLHAEALAGDRLVASFALDAAEQATRAGIPLLPVVRQGLERLRDQGDPGLSRAAVAVLHAAAVREGPACATASELEALGPDQEREIELPEGVSALELAAALVPSARAGHGYWIEPRGASRVRVTRGDRLEPRPWRILHELRSPTPTKRQGWSHTLGRSDLGRIRVPPGGLAEESPTGVPGQRVRSERQDGWAPEVPLVEDCLHALARGEVHIVSAQGVTSVRAPTGGWARALARLRLSWSFAAFDGLRRADLAEPAPAAGQDAVAPRADRYLPALRQLGLEITQERGPGTAAPGALAALSWAPGLGELLRKFTAYSVNMAAGSLSHLLVAALLLLSLVFGRSALLLERQRRARAGLPLVIGGWGTRGKSGTERCKAGLFEGLGVPVFSKTTGCEAMFLHAPPGGHAREIFLFRPYEKATIWEQTDVTWLASRLGARTLLWECMGLNPIYVDVLQQRWMRDDLSTLTNAYPDHEDIQGPTGQDVAETIAGFCPSNALLLTTERNMLPVLAATARQRRSGLISVPRVDCELIPGDLLARFPYLEHPSNVGLAASVAEALGVPRVEAIGWMAEHVVPDLGALIVYPGAWHMGREVVFANGMSANDRLSFLHSWRRVGLDVVDPALNPAEWVVTVVNNRADRVPRSRIFAEILAEDAAAHRHVLIGTNLRGLRGYVFEAVDARLARAAAGEGGAARTLTMFRHLRLVDPGDLGEACARRLGAPPQALRAWRAAVSRLGPAGEPTLQAGRRAAEVLRADALALEGAIPDPASAGLGEHLLEAAARQLAVRALGEASITAMQALYRELVEASLVIVEDDHATGDQILARAVGSVPPGALARLMGVQNIKGTGLGFAYLWVHWRELHAHLRTLQAPGAGAATQLRRGRALDLLAEHPFDSLLACDAATPVLRALEADPVHAARAAQIGARLSAAATALRTARSGEASGRSRKGSALLDRLERLLDPLDAVLRRRRATQVYRDLIWVRISHGAAVEILRELMSRHKGGWLTRSRRAAP